MDWNELRDQVSNLSLYDLKAGVRKVQNAVMNLTPMESKVREATNNEPWGASSTLMQEIANSTFNYQLLNEIMPMIYKRFTEKSAEEWRQIYKALQLLEFLIKNGSERVIDDARSHLSLLKMLKQFHFIDQNGKDQGINIRNRSKELTDLLGDVDKIRTERKKSRATRNKYTGVEGGAGAGIGSGPSGRYGGFGSESAGYGGDYGASTRGVYGDGGGFGGESHDDYDEGGQRSGAERFEEYDEFDDGGAQATPGRRKSDMQRTLRTTAKKAEPAKPAEPQIDLFDFGDDEPSGSGLPLPPPSNGTATASAPSILTSPSAGVAGGDEDDFDDFQSATPSAAAPPPIAAPTILKPNYSSISTAGPTSTTQYAQPTPQYGAPRADFSNLFSTTSPPSSTSATPSNASAFSIPTTQPKPSGYQPTGPNYFTSVQAQGTQQQASGTSGSGVISPGRTPATAGRKPSGGDAFASLLGGSVKKTNSPAQKAPTMADMVKQKSHAGLYGANAPSIPSQPAAASKPNTGSALDDLLG